MKEIVLALIGQLNSSVFVLLLILLLAGVLLYKMGTWTQKFKTHDGKVEKLENLAEKVVSLTTKIDLIYQYTNPNAPLRAQSPVALTPVGHEISTNLRAGDLFNKYSARLISEVEKTAPNNAYDIQQASLQIAKSKMINMLDESELVKVKQEAFNRGILTEDVMGIFGIFLRNEILRQKGISLAEVDAHTPPTAPSGI